MVSSMRVSAASSASSRSRNPRGSRAFGRNGCCSFMTWGNLVERGTPIAARERGRKKRCPAWRGLQGSVGPFGRALATGFFAALIPVSLFPRTLAFLQTLAVLRAMALCVGLLLGLKGELLPFAGKFHEGGPFIGF